MKILEGIFLDEGKQLKVMQSFVMFWNARAGWNVIFFNVWFQITKFMELINDGSHISVCFLARSFVCLVRIFSTFDQRS